MTATAKKPHDKHANLTDAELLEMYPETLGPGIIGHETYARVQEIRQRTNNARFGPAIVGAKNGERPDQSGKKTDDEAPRANRTKAPPLPKPAQAATRPAAAVGKMPVLAEEWDGWRRNDMLKIIRANSLDCKSTANRDECAELLAAAGVAPPERE